MSTGQWLILMVTLAFECGVIGFALGEAHGELRRRKYER